VGVGHLLVGVGLLVGEEVEDGVEFTQLHVQGGGLHEFGELGETLG